MFIRRQKVRKKSGTKIYYSIVESISGKKHPRLKHKKYLGTVERIMKVFDFYDKRKD